MWAPESSIVPLARACHFAAVRHVRQRPKGEAAEPYMNHLSDCSSRVSSMSRRRHCRSPDQLRVCGSNARQCLLVGRLLRSGSGSEPTFGMSACNQGLRVPRTPSAVSAGACRSRRTGQSARPSPANRRGVTTSMKAISAHTSP